MVDKSRFRSREVSDHSLADDAYTFYFGFRCLSFGGVVTCSTYIGVVLKEERGMYLQIHMYRGSLNRKKWLKGGEWWGAMQGVA